MVKPAKIAGATIDELLENLKLHEYRSRYRTHRELRGHETKAVTAALAKWIPTLTDERHLLEALWVSWGANQINKNLLKKLLQSKDHRVRAAAVQVLQFNSEQFQDYHSLLAIAAEDEHGRVRLGAINAASYLAKEKPNPS